MKNRLSQMLFHGSGLKWRHRRQELAETARVSDPLLDTRELFAASHSPAQRAHLSPGARLLYRTLCGHDEYVICIDPPAIAAQVGVSEQKIHCCLNELRRAGIISTWIGNLVFFE